ncbi:jeltraxin-like [Leptodactylus fuscus]|uniref:jeltraxin-like isoform X2 n=1 Tax=Leptodactylus fuscus TaxID=238119 RepID=UPI003F4E5FB3
MKILMLLFMVIIGCCAKENLRGASFLFSQKSKTTKLVMKPNMTEPLSSITVCLQAYTDNIQRDSLFKLVNDSKTYFHLYNTQNYFTIEIDKDGVYFKTSEESLEWRLICVSWESKTGLIHLVVNGNIFPRRVLKPGFLIDPIVTAVIGQDLDLSSFSPAFSYVGEIRQVNVWNRALHPNEMKLMYHNDWYRRRGNIIDWESVDYEIFGDVFLYKP